MGNLKRCFEEGRAYFVTSVTKGRAPIFEDGVMARQLLISIEYYKAFFGYKIFAYCVMPDHIHFLVQPNQDFPLPFIMKMIKGSFARRLNKMARKTGSVWQKRYYDEAIRTDRQLLNQIEYIHNNPVISGLVRVPEQYKFSSHSQYYSDVAAHQVLLEISKPS